MSLVLDASLRYNHQLINGLTDIFYFGGLLQIIWGAGCISIYNYRAKRIFDQNMIVMNRFKQIMDKSTEGIIIMNEKTIEYINDKFIEQ